MRRVTKLKAPFVIGRSNLLAGLGVVLQSAAAQLHDGAVREARVALRDEQLMLHPRALGEAVVEGTQVADVHIGTWQCRGVQPATVCGGESVKGHLAALEQRTLLQQQLARPGHFARRLEVG